MEMGKGMLTLDIKELMLVGKTEETTLLCEREWGWKSREQSFPLSEIEDMLMEGHQEAKARQKVWNQSARDLHTRHSSFRNPNWNGTTQVGGSLSC
jgi:hypothetical protein